MSSTMKWVLGVILVVVIVVLALWWGGVFGGGVATTAPAQESAAVVNSVPTTSGTSTSMVATGALADSVIDADVAGIDAQVASINTTLAGITAPTKVQISALAASFQAVGNSMTALSAKLNVRIKNAGNAGLALQAPLADLSHQLSNIGSQTSAASKNAMMASSTSATYRQSFKQLQAAKTYLQAARADVKVVLQGLNVK